MTTFAVSPFDPRTAPQSQKLAVGQLLADAFAYAYPDDPPKIPESIAVEIAHLLPDEGGEHRVIWDGERALAWGKLGYTLDQNLHAAYANIVVHPSCRRQGMARAISHELEAVARREGRDTVTFSTTDRVPAAEAYAQRLGAQPALPMRQSRLHLSEVPADLLRDWQFRPDGDPYRLHIWQIVPDEYLERTAELMMVMNSAPKGDLDMEDWKITPAMIRAWEKMTEAGGEVTYLLAVEHKASGQLDGYSQVFWEPKRAAVVYQGATAVRPEARGRGLGKWLKAAMIDQIAAHCPGARWIQTNNANVNEAMLGINVAMGFKHWAQLTEWQLKLPEV